MGINYPVFLFSDKARKNGVSAWPQARGQIRCHFYQRAGKDIGKNQVVGLVLLYQRGLVTVAYAGSNYVFQTIVFGILAGDQNRFVVDVNGDDLCFPRPEFSGAEG